MSQPLNVLIVEDEALLAMELESLIEEAGHRVVGWAMSSDEAKAMVDTERADIAIMGSGDVTVEGRARCKVNSVGSGSLTCESGTEETDKAA